MSSTSRIDAGYPRFYPAISEISIASFKWTEVIQGERVSLHAVTSEKSEYYDAVYEKYNLDYDKSMKYYCICDENNKPIGYIEIDEYSSLSELRNQISDEHLAQSLFYRGKVLELSYSVEKRGLGYGTRAVKAWVDDAKQNAWGKHLFAVVGPNNVRSRKILEKNISLDGEYTNKVSGGDFLVYSLK